uniref:Doublecortin like kinase 3 n=1 Tax=Chelonoidis abingdonii TaxID=106734 RepID=A0A8C0G3C4_CHEAB
MENEILIIKSLSHPNIVSLIEVYETETEIYLILEYVPGGDLFDAIIESVKFTEHDAALMITDLCEALVYIHGKNIVHRDLKPENLLVNKSTTLKLADFGLAKKVTKPIFTVCGTPTYVSPEILAEKGYGLEVDMWATGVILYILLCGFPPFRSQERDQEELFQIIQLGHYEFLSPYWDSISGAAKDLITRLLVIDPQKRYTAQQVLQHPWIRTAGKTNKPKFSSIWICSLEGAFPYLHLSFFLPSSTSAIFSDHLFSLLCQFRCLNKAKQKNPKPTKQKTNKKPQTTQENSQKQEKTKACIEILFSLFLFILLKRVKFLSSLSSSAHTARLFH